MLEHAVRRIGRYLERRGALEADDGVDAADNDNGGQLEAFAVSGQVPPAGPQWQRGLRALEPRGLAYDKPLCASLDGFTLHAATRAGALDTAGREALLRYVLRPPVAQERIEPQEDGLIAITLKRAYADGTAVVMDPLSPQAHLLRMLDGGEYPRLGGRRRSGQTQPRRSAVRR